MKAFDGDVKKFFGSISLSPSFASFSYSYSSTTSTSSTGNGITTSSSTTTSEKSIEVALTKTLANEVENISLKFGKNTTATYEEDSSVGSIRRDLGVDLERKENFVPGSSTPMLYCFKQGTFEKLAEIPLSVGHTDAHIPESVTDCDIFINDSNNQTQFALKNKKIV